MPGEITDWQEELNTIHRRISARVEHAIGQLAGTASGIAYLRNITG